VRRHGWRHWLGAIEGRHDGRYGAAGSAWHGWVAWVVSLVVEWVASRVDANGGLDLATQALGKPSPRTASLSRTDSGDRETNGTNPRLELPRPASPEVHRPQPSSGPSSISTIRRNKPSRCANGVTRNDWRNRSLELISQLRRANAERCYLEVKFCVSRLAGRFQ